MSRGGAAGDGGRCRQDGRDPRRGETYRALAPPEVLEGLNLAHRTGQWRRFPAEPGPAAPAGAARGG